MRPLLHHRYKTPILLPEGMAEHVIRAADDIVWDSNQDAYGAARTLMFATMRYRIMPTVVSLTRHWARAKAAEHAARADALRKILIALLTAHHDGAQGVARLQAHHELIAKRYASVALAMQD